MTATCHDSSKLQLCYPLGTQPSAVSLETSTLTYSLPKRSRRLLYSTLFFFPLLLIFPIPCLREFSSFLLVNTPSLEAASVPLTCSAHLANSCNSSQNLQTFLFASNQMPEDNRWHCNFRLKVAHLKNPTHVLPNSAVTAEEFQYALPLFSTIPRP